MVARKTLPCVLLVLVGIVIHANASVEEWTTREPEEEWTTEVSEEDPVTDDTIWRKTCPPKEHYNKCKKNKGSCERTCLDYNENPGVCPGDCKPGCICDRGFVRGPDGICIKPKRCPSTKCPSGEHYDRCSLNCQKECSNWNSTLPCTHDCTPGCVCDEGTVRSALPNGKCVKTEECKAPEENKEGLPIPFLCRKKNQQYSICPSLCSDDCTNYQDTKRPCRKVCLPLPACVCKSGYVHGPDGECIKPDQCPADKKPEDCTELEKYTTCGTSCEDNCDNYQEKDRDCGTRCNVGCFCLPGYVRGPKGDCIFPFDCPAKSPQKKELIDNTDEDDYDSSEEEKEESSEESLSKRDPKYDKKIPDDNAEIENDEEKEEKSEPRMIPQSLFCKKNEVYSLCPSLCPDNCTNYQDRNRACKIVCLPIPGCVCKSGFVKGPDGTCIKQEKCRTDKKPDDCLDNEYYDTCGSSCPDDCKNYNSDENTCDKKCNIGCFCRPGMVRGPNGQCIWPFECEIKPSKSEELESQPSSPENSSFCPSNEGFDPCHAEAENDCSTRNQTTPPKPQAWCLAGCRCKPGYVRGPRGNCIKPTECPETDNTHYPVPRVCPKDEVWSTAAQCQRNCSDTRTKLCSRIPAPGCVCKQGYLRNPKGMCVPEYMCSENQQGVGIIPADELQIFGCPSQYSCRQHCVGLGGRGGYCVGPGLRYCFCYK